MSRSHKLSKTTSNLIAIALLVICVSYVATSRCTAAKPQGSIDTAAAELQKVALPEGTQSVIVEYPGFTVSFNPEHHLANYVAWELTPAELNKAAERSNKFVEDPSVSGSATPDDYRHSGFDRGHLAPAGDMAYSNDAMLASFKMPNITPQHPMLNQRAWRVLEENCRRWAAIDSSLIIICGPVLTDKITQTIGTTGVSVPQRFFKVILAPHANPPRAIGFIMPNSYVEGGMARTAVSVDQVEAITGMDFFSALPDSLENAIEADTHFAKWLNRSKHNGR